METTIELLIINNPSGYSDGNVIYSVRTDLTDVEEIKTELNKLGYETSNEGKFWADRQFDALIQKGKNHWWLMYDIPSLN